MTLDERLTRWLDANYQSVFGATIIRRYNTEAEQRRCGDVLVRTESGERNIEEKAHAVRDLQWLAADCLIELIQDVGGPWEATKTRGWFFALHECDFLLNAYFFPPEAPTPAVIKMLRWKRTRRVMLKAIADGRQLHTRWVKAGFGLTLCAYVPYSLLADCVVREWRA